MAAACLTGAAYGALNKCQVIREGGLLLRSTSATPLQQLEGFKREATSVSAAVRQLRRRRRRRRRLLLDDQLRLLTPTSVKRGHSRQRHSLSSSRLPAGSRQAWPPALRPLCSEACGRGGRPAPMGGCGDGDMGRAGVRSYGVNAMSGRRIHHVGPAFQGGHLSTLSGAAARGRCDGSCLLPELPARETESRRPPSRRQAGHDA